MVCRLFCRYYFECICFGFNGNTSAAPATTPVHGIIRPGALFQGGLHPELVGFDGRCLFPPPGPLVGFDLCEADAGGGLRGGHCKPREETERKQQQAGSGPETGARTDLCAVLRDFECRQTIGLVLIVPQNQVLLVRQVQQANKAERDRHVPAAKRQGRRSAHEPMDGCGTRLLVQTSGRPVAPWSRASASP